jgi:hypothetical protein
MTDLAILSFCTEISTVPESLQYHNQYSVPVLVPVPFSSPQTSTCFFKPDEIQHSSRLLKWEVHCLLTSWRCRVNQNKTFPRRDSPTKRSFDCSGTFFTTCTSDSCDYSLKFSNVNVSNLSPYRCSSMGKLQGSIVFLAFLISPRTTCAIMDVSCGLLNPGSACRI